MKRTMERYGPLRSTFIVKKREHGVMSITKAFKLIEALAEECTHSTVDDFGWARCRRCLASEMVDTEEARQLFREILAAKDLRKGGKA